MVAVNECSDCECEIKEDHQQVKQGPTSKALNGLTLKLLCVYTLVNSRLFSHPDVSQGNIYYPITTTMPISPMCEAGFT